MGRDILPQESREDIYSQAVVHLVLLREKLALF